MQLLIYAVNKLKKFREVNMAVDNVDIFQARLKAASLWTTCSLPKHSGLVTKGRTDNNFNSSWPSDAQCDINLCQH